MPKLIEDHWHGEIEAENKIRMRFQKAAAFEIYKLCFVTRASHSVTRGSYFFNSGDNLDIL